MNSKLLLIIPLMVFLLVPTTAFSQTDFSATSAETTSQFEETVAPAPAELPEVGVFKEYDNILNEDGSYSYSTHTPYFETEQGEFVPYRLTEDDSMVQVEIDGGKFVFNKDFGAVTVLDDEGIVIDSDSYIVKSATVNQDVWNNLTVNNSPVTTTVEELDDDVVVVSFTRSNDEGIFKVEYVLNNGMLKTTAYFTNLSLENQKISFTETLQMVKDISINDEPIDLDLYAGQTFPRETLEQNEDLILEIKDLVYGAGIGFEQLWSVSVHDNRMVSLDYGKQTEDIVNIGDTVELDPTMTVGNTVTNLISGGSSSYGSSSCNSWSSSGVWNNDGSYLGKNSSGRCYATYYHPVFSLPAGAMVTDTKLTYQYQVLSGCYNASYCHFNLYQLSSGTTNTATSFAPQSFGGAKYYANVAPASYSSQTITLNSAANSDIEIHGELNMGVSTVNTYYSNYMSRMKQPSVTVTYSLPVVPSVPTNVDGYQTATDEIRLTWTASTTGNPSPTYDITRNGTSIATGVSDTFYNDSHTPTINGTGIPYTVTATNSAGSSSAVSVTVTPWGSPAVPTGLNASDGNPIVTSWNTVADDTVVMKNVVVNWQGTIGAWAIQSDGKSLKKPSTGWSYASDTTTTIPTGNSYYYYVNPSAPSHDSIGLMNTTVTGSNNVVPDGYRVWNYNGVPAIGTHHTVSSSASAEQYIAYGYDWGTPSNPKVHVTMDSNGFVYLYHSGSLLWSSNYAFDSTESYYPHITGYYNTTVFSMSDETVTYPSVTLPTTYNLYRDGTEISTSPLTGTTYSDSAVADGTTYSYTVTSENTISQSSASTASTATTPDIPDTPSAPTVTTDHSNGISTITWTAPNANGSAIDSYGVYRSGTYLGSLNALSLSDSGGTLGTSYTYTVNAHNAVGWSPQSSASNSVTPSTIPAIPSAPVATTETVNGTNTITWTAPNANGSAITDYRLYANGNLLNTLNATTFTHSPVLGVATTYQVSATNANGYSSLSGASNSVTASTAPDTPVAPVATFTSNTSNTITITAPSDNSSNIDDYRLYENGTLVGSIGVPTGLSHVVTGITVTTTNNYQVSAHNANGWSGISPVSNSVLSANAPASPTLTGTSGSPTVLNWTAPQSDMTITNYKIYRDGTLHDTVGNVLTYSDSTNLVAGTTYGYTVSAVGQTIGEGSQSNSVSLVAGLPPDAPTGLSTSINNPNTTPLEITVNWSAPSYTGTSTITNYEVYRDGTLVATVGNVLTHTDTVPTGGGTFVYSLKAVTAHGISVMSATASQTTATVPPTPTVSPTLTIVSPDVTPLDITASWVAQATGGSALTGYEVFRSTDNVTFTSVGTTTTLSLTDTVPSAGLYYYKFSSTNLIGNSSQSASSNTATPTVPDASSVTAFIANPNPSPFDVSVSFVAPSNNGGSAVTGYNLYLSPDDITYTQVATNVTSTQVVTVSGVGTHYFKSEAINLIGTGALGSAVTVATPNTPDAPSLTLAIPDPNNFPFDTTATFVAPTNNGGSLVTGYNLYYSSDDITYTSIATATSSVISHTVGSAGTHYFKAESISNAGTGVLSSAFTIATPTVPDASSVTLAINNPNPSPFIITSTLVAPSFDGGSTVNSYNLHYSSDGTTYTQIATAINGTFDYTVSGVGTHYFKSQATNLIGTGVLGTAVSIATPAVPDAPSITLTIPSPDTTPLSINSSFVLPANNGGSNVTGYNLYHSTDNITFTQIATNVTADQTTVVANAGTYYFKAEAISNAGTGVLSSAFTIATPTVPNAPSITLTIPDPNASPFTVNSSFVVPANTGGSAVTGYNLYTSNDNVTFTQIATNVTADQTTVVATAGTYYFKSEAINLIGTGALSSAFTIATPTVPSVPLNATSAISNVDTAPYTMIVSWDTPTSNGGSNLTGYDVYRKQGSASPVFITNTTALTITDIVPSVLSTNFTYQIYSVNNVGQSATYVDTVVTTNNVPSAPALNFTTGTTSLSWNIPTSDATVTGYKVFRDSVLLTTVTTLTHTDWTPITFGQSYTYEVKAVSVLGDSVSSNSIVTMPETEITGMISSGITGTGAVIDWDAPAYYQGNLTYNVWYVTPAITTGTPTVSAGTTLNTYSNFSPQLDYDTSYTFGVTITSPLGNSGFSNLVTLTTNVDGSIVSSDPLTGGMAWFDIDSVSEASLDVIEFQRETQLVPPSPTSDPQVLTDTLQVAYPSWWDDMTCNVDYKFAQKTEQYVEGTDMTSIPVATNADRQVIGFSFQDVDNEVITVQCAPQQSSEGDEGSGVYVMTQNSLGTVGTIGAPNIPLVTMIAGFSNGSYGTDGDFGALNIVGLFAILISMVGFNRVSPIVGVILSASLIFALAWFGIITIPTVIIGTIALVIFLAWGANRQR